MLDNAEFEREAKKIRIFARLIARTKPNQASVKKIINIFMSPTAYEEGIETFETLDFFHAAYCYSKGLQISGLKRVGTKHKVIMQGKDAHKIAMTYLGKECVEKKLFEAYKTLKDFAYRPKEGDLFYEDSKNNSTRGDG